MSQQTENRVKKLTKFFGDEPPLLRLYLKNLGYEKYASIFEEAKIGMLELPYLSEERLEKLGIPLGPRIRILQVCRRSPSFKNITDFLFLGSQDTLQSGWTELQRVHPLAFRRP